MSAPLAGIRVADFSHVIAGPYCTMVLADMGAEVIKVEPPEGDATRGYKPPEIGGESAVFLCYNRNKRSVALDLAKEEGRKVARDIAAHADVLVENFATGVMQRLGLDYAALKESNPRLIYCSISAYGRSGAFAARAGYDPIVQAESGLMSLNGYAGRDPLRTPLALIDITTGMYAAQAILAALYARESSGRGQYIEAALFDNAFALTASYTMNYLATGIDPGPPGNRSPAVAPMDVFEASDGKFYLTVAGERVWRKLLDALHNPAELQAPEFASNGMRVQNVSTLGAALQCLFRQKTREEWMSKFRAAGVPAGPICSIAEAVDSAEAKERGILTMVPHGGGGEVPNLRLPMSLSDTPMVAPRGAPLLGEHTGQVLSGLLNYSAARIGELQQLGVIPPSRG
jgi:crotonobetainyl-CoA:carnitine CoA-transferase CaiB-like acyl-CoA transferase